MSAWVQENMPGIQVHRDAGGKLGIMFVFESKIFVVLLGIFVHYQEWGQTELIIIHKTVESRPPHLRPRYLPARVEKRLTMLDGSVAVGKVLEAGQF